MQCVSLLLNINCVVVYLSLFLKRAVANSSASFAIAAAMFALSKTYI